MKLSCFYHALFFSLWVYVDEVHRVLSVPVGQLEGSTGEASPAAHRLSDRVHEGISRIHTLLIHSAVRHASVIWMG